MRKVLLVTAHDYRSPWRANFHFIADAYRDLGRDVSFLSVGYSPLSRLKGDHRNALSVEPNRWEMFRGIRCFLWKTPFHPFKGPVKGASFLTSPLFRAWPKLGCPEVDAAARDADVIIVESDVAILLIPRLKAQAPEARLVYLASDLLETIVAPPQLIAALYEVRESIDQVVAPARKMAEELSYLERPTSYVPHGINPGDFEEQSLSPYSGASNVVTIGKMLFDKQVVVTAAEAFPDTAFHLIGTIDGGGYPENVVEHAVMAHSDLIPWLRHASVGLAPYRPSPGSSYISDSSMKLMQFEYLGLPAVCPHFAVGDHPNRFGYDPVDKASVIAAFGAALAAMRPPPEVAMAPFKSWAQVAQMIAGDAF